MSRRDVQRMVIALAACLTAAGCTVPAVPPAPAPTAPDTAAGTAGPSPASDAPAQPCVTGPLLVPTCGVLWGAAAGGFTSVPRDVALQRWEAMTGRTATIFHTYHRGDDLFPTPAEVAMTDDDEHPRVLLANWKVCRGMTWAQVAAGGQDARIDRWARYVTRTYHRKFFLALEHEPEPNVDPTAGSGMTAADFAAMYRHVVTRLRSDGVTNVVHVIAYMANERWLAAPWWTDLYPGNDYVDWLGLDSYVSVERGSYHYGTFADLVDRAPSDQAAGFYGWSVRNHPGKPIMVAEWGAYHRTRVVMSKAPVFDTVVSDLEAHPAIKAVVYFDTRSDKYGDRNISVQTDADSLSAFRRLAADPLFRVRLR